MIKPALQSPEVLVLGGGGILGEAWMSAVLAGLDEAEGFDARECGRYIGTSAGSIVAASLVAGLAPAARLGRLPEQPPVSAVEAGEGATPLRQALAVAAEMGGTAAAPLVSLALSSTAASGALLRRTALRRLPAGRRSLAGLGEMVDGMGVGWDGRLRIAALELASGRRVLFGSSGAPEVSVSVAVQASCAIPGVFRAVRAGGRSYVDGGVWSPSNMDAAEVESGDRVLCLNPTGSVRLAAGPLGALGLLSRGAATSEALLLKRRGAIVTTINPDEASAAIMGANLMDPRRRGAVIESGLAQARLLVAQNRPRAA